MISRQAAILSLGFLGIHPPFRRSTRPALSLFLPGSKVPQKIVILRYLEIVHRNEAKTAIFEFIEAFLQQCKGALGDWLFVAVGLLSITKLNLYFFRVRPAAIHFA